MSSYIRKWQGSGRFARAVTLGQQMGYTKTIAQEFIRQNLPPQFVYLAMQESDFDPFTSGPPTSFGIAKGMWQFIPETGARYGLTIGPLANVRKPTLLTIGTTGRRRLWRRRVSDITRPMRSVWTARDGVVRWGERRVINLLRTMRQPEGSNSEAAGEISRSVTEGNVRLRVLYRIGCRDRRKPPTLRLFVRHPLAAAVWPAEAGRRAAEPHEGTCSCVR
jgi:hypothetical protein